LGATNSTGLARSSVLVRAADGGAGGVAGGCVNSCAARKASSSGGDDAACMRRQRSAGCQVWHKQPRVWALPQTHWQRGCGRSCPAAWGCAPQAWQSPPSRTGCPPARMPWWPPPRQSLKEGVGGGAKRALWDGPRGHGVAAGSGLEMVVCIHVAMEQGNGSHKLSLAVMTVTQVSMAAAGVAAGRRRRGDRRVSATVVPCRPSIDPSEASHKANPARAGPPARPARRASGP